jgi:hypothetical protein
VLARLSTDIDFILEKKKLPIMTSEGSKKRRIMIITADESIIEQLQSNGNASLFKSIILDSNGDNVELSHSHSKDLQPEMQSSTNKKSKNDLLTCVVCGSPAHGYNFDAISCESCKAFFRRNALKDPVRFYSRKYLYAFSFYRQH